MYIINGETGFSVTTVQSKTLKLTIKSNLCIYVASISSPFPLELSVIGHCDKTVKITAHDLKIFCSQEVPGIFWLKYHKHPGNCHGAKGVQRETVSETFCLSSFASLE